MNNDQIAELRDDNIRRATAMHDAGYPLPASLVFNTYLTVLIDHVLPPSSPARRRYDEAVERAMAEHLTAGEQALARTKLLGDMAGPFGPGPSPEGTVIDVNEVVPQKGWRS